MMWFYSTVFLLLVYIGVVQVSKCKRDAMMMMTMTERSSCRIVCFSFFLLLLLFCIYIEFVLHIPSTYEHHKDLPQTSGQKKSAYIEEYRWVKLAVKENSIFCESTECHQIFRNHLTIFTMVRCVVCATLNGFVSVMCIFFILIAQWKSAISPTLSLSLSLLAIFIRQLFFSAHHDLYMYVWFHMNI